MCIDSCCWTCTSMPKWDAQAFHRSKIQCITIRWNLRGWWRGDLLMKSSASCREGATSSVASISSEFLASYSVVGVVCCMVVLNSVESQVWRYLWGSIIASEPIIIPNKSRYYTLIRWTREIIHRTFKDTNNRFIVTLWYYESKS